MNTITYEWMQNQISYSNFTVLHTSFLYLREAFCSQEAFEAVPKLVQ